MDEQKDITELFSEIDAYLFKYKPQIQEEYAGTLGVDDKEHVGVMAQELLSNPLTESTVNTEGDYLTVDTDKLVMTLAAVMSDMAKEIQDIKARLEYLENGE